MQQRARSLEEEEVAVPEKHGVQEMGGEEERGAPKGKVKAPVKEDQPLIIVVVEPAKGPEAAVAHVETVPEARPPAIVEGPEKEVEEEDVLYQVIPLKPTASHRRAWTAYQTAKSYVVTIRRLIEGDPQQDGITTMVNDLLGTGKIGKAKIITEMQASTQDAANEELLQANTILGKAKEALDMALTSRDPQLVAIYAEQVIQYRDRIKSSLNIVRSIHQYFSRVLRRGQKIPTRTQLQNKVGAIMEEAVRASNQIHYLTRRIPTVFLDLQNRSSEDLNTAIKETISYNCTAIPRLTTHYLDELEKCLKSVDDESGVPQLEEAQGFAAWASIHNKRIQGLLEQAQSMAETFDTHFRLRLVGKREPRLKKLASDHAATQAWQRTALRRMKSYAERKQKTVVDILFPHGEFLKKAQATLYEKMPPGWVRESVEALSTELDNAFTNLTRTKDLLISEEGPVQTLFNIPAKTELSNENMETARINATEVGRQLQYATEQLDKMQQNLSQIIEAADATVKEAEVDDETKAEREEALNLARRVLMETGFQPARSRRVREPEAALLLEMEPEIQQPAAPITPPTVPVAPPRIVVAPEKPEAVAARVAAVPAIMPKPPEAAAVEEDDPQEELNKLIQNINDLKVKIIRKQFRVLEHATPIRLESQLVVDLSLLQSNVLLATQILENFTTENESQREIRETLLQTIREINTNLRERKLIIPKSLALTNLQRRLLSLQRKHAQTRRRRRRRRPGTGQRKHRD